MFKIFILNPDFPQAVEDLQATYDVLSVQMLGFDQQNKYVLVQYGNKTPSTPPPDSGNP